MENLSVKEARELLMGENAPLSDERFADAADQEAALPPDGLEGEEEPENSEKSEEPEEPSESEDSEEQSYVDNAVGLGIDIVEIARMKKILERIPAFAEKVFSPAERAYCDSTASPATHYALRFAAKEAVVKALGTGFADGIWVHDIEVERAKSGRPSVKLSGRALEVAREQGVRDLSLSMSYTHTDAVACAMAVTDASVRASEARKDPMEELARQFKETRKMLDDI